MDLVFDIKEGFQKKEKVNNTLVLIGELDNTPNNIKVLEALLSAIKLNKNSIDLVVYPEKSNLHLPGGYENVLVFGDQSQHFKNTNFSLNRIFRMESGNVLFTSSLTQLIEDKNKKLALWQQLQKMFLN